MRRFYAVLMLLAACGPTPRFPGPETPLLSAEEVARRIPDHVADREGWAADIVFALEAARVRPDERAVCAVLAVIAQESGYAANPAVSNLPSIVRTGMYETARNKLGLLGPPAVDKLLSMSPERSRLTFGQRLDRARTERDVDLLFRDMTEKVPLHDFLPLENLNPVTTIGAMQVSVRFARERSRKNDEEIRDELYTRQGGIYFGVARLFHAPAADPEHLFADYNAGMFASRNAAFQKQLARLAKTSLRADGDLLRYDKSGRPRSEPSETLRALFALRDMYHLPLSNGRIRADAEKEKDEVFEKTDTYKAVKRLYAEKYGPPATAQIPDVTLHSEKLARDRTTAWFASSVMRRYERCVTQ